MLVHTLLEYVLIWHISMFAHMRRKQEKEYHEICTLMILNELL